MPTEKMRELLWTSIVGAEKRLFIAQRVGMVLRKKQRTLWERYAQFPR